MPPPHIAAIGPSPTSVLAGATFSSGTILAFRKDRNRTRSVGRAQSRRVLPDVAPNHLHKGKTSKLGSRPKVLRGAWDDRDLLRPPVL